MIPSRARPQTSRCPSFVRAIALACALAGATPGTLTAQLSVHHRFHLAVGDAAARVTATVTGVRAATLRVRLPAFSTAADPRIRHATWKAPSIRAVSGAGNDELAVREIGRGSWSIVTGGAREVRLAYTLPLVGRKTPTGLGRRSPFRFEKDGKPATIRYHEAFVLRGAETWLEIGEAAQRVSADLPDGFEVTTSLRRTDDGSFACADARTLMGSPMVVGRSETSTFSASDTPHRVTLAGFDRDRTDRAEFLDTLRRIVAANHHAMGKLPYDRYAFLIGRQADFPHGDGYGTSAEIITHSLQSSKVLLRNLAGAHFASWSWPSLHPASRDDLALDGSTMTEEAWFWLGLREYYTELALLRAGLAEPKRFWTDTVAARINTLQRDPRRSTVTTAELGRRMKTTSDLRRPRGPHPRDVGFLLCLLLDVEIRVATAGRRSLDEAVRGLVHQCRTTRKGYTNHDIQAWCEKVGSRKLDALFTHIHATTELPLTRTLAKLGIAAAPGTPPEPRVRQNKRGPKPRKRPPRWRVKVLEKPPHDVAKLRDELTKPVVH